MKLLPFLFLLSFACEAQDYVFIDTNAVKELGATIGRIKNATQQWAEREGTKTLSLEEKLLLYAQECYNDSTLVRVHRDDVNCGWTCPDWHYVGKKYIHREPTFKRFIEWLRKNQ